MPSTARRAAIATLVSGGIVVVALALWKLLLVLALLFTAMIIAAAIRPGIDWLNRHRIPKPAGLALNYLLLLGVVAVGIAFAAPRALDQVNHALSKSGKAEIAREAKHSSGIKHEALLALQKRLQHLPKKSELVKPATQVGAKAFEVIIGIFFTFATAAYWIFERDKAVDVVCSLIPRPKRKLVRDTWTLIDLRLGAFVRGQFLLILAVGTALSLLFWAIGEPYWILVGAFAGLVEIIPVIGPLVAGALAVAVGFTASLHVALLAVGCVLGVRLLEDYLIMPKVLGEAVGLSPLLVLVSVTSVGLLFSGWAVLFAVPIAAVLVTLFDVVLRDRDPAEEETPAVIFSPKEDAI
ncbi:MAG: AI-2E family transporter [Actinobacteria bacterium]|nr:AI-2E family transporter [Actinomycetota bacterium]